MILLRGLRVENFKLLRRVELTFPRQGSVLVEGLNESGKSTLFESIFFALYGAPLVAEGRGRGNLESVIRYGEDSASVELLLEVDEAELEIRRSVRRNKPTQASLAIRRPAAPDERVSGVLAVNSRVVDELGGLDGEALLNSCFVEQKKLSKLEDLAAGQRKDSLRKLLNLEKLTLLGDRFRVTLQDERALAEARERLEMAEAAALLPPLEMEKAALESHLRGPFMVTGAGAATEGGHPYINTNSGPGSHDTDTGPGLAGASAGSRLTGVGAGVSAGPVPGGWDWSGHAARLDSLRASRAASRTRTLFLAVGAVILLLAGTGLLLAGSQAGLWLLPGALALGAPAVLAMQSAGRSDTEIRRALVELAKRRDGLLASIGDLSARRARAEGRLGIEVGSLDLEECRQEVERLARQREVKQYAASLLEGAMERIVRMVLPSTERNLGQILPLLTAGRYHEARIAEDYQIQVWDDAAGRYVSKAVFSGGARDQFSLALRLAFALATLPEELGAAPGFLFLDEPLSSFDGPRTEALVQLLTAGQVASNFSQIFVISHNRSFDTDAFQYRMVLRDGRIEESTLPGG